MSSISQKITVKEIGEVQSFEGSDFTKRDLIGEYTDNGYTNIMHFEFLKDKTKLLDEILPETEVTVHFNIRCRKVEAKKKGQSDMYFTSLNGWKIDI